LVQDVSRFSPLGWRAPQDQSSSHLNRTRSVCNDSILEAGLDERGEAPPPYNTAGGDKVPPISRRETVQPMEAGGLAMRQIPVDQRATRRLPPDYSENGASGDGIDSPTRPGTVVTVA